MYPGKGKSGRGFVYLVVICQDGRKGRGWILCYVCIVEEGRRGREDEGVKGELRKNYGGWSKEMGVRK